METIDITEALLQFKKHIDENPRTILSAKFGDGKSYFLNEFINQNSCKNSGNTYFITLHPINYSVAQNEDVFEYVKRDILVQLNKDEKLPNIDLETLFKTFNWDDVKSLIAFALGFMPHGELCKRILDFAGNKYKSYESKCNTFCKYESVFKNQKGGLYECDAYTELIRTTLSAIRTPEKTFKTCLVIEDLDRIDPAHLFRILNVIGAHIDIEKENKFGFDNIVLVMDYDVTGHIFHHFYGEQANYEGYMAKFYSGNPFHYSIHQSAVEQFVGFLKNKYHIPDKLFYVEYCHSNTNYTKQTLESRLCELSVRDIKRTIDKIESSIINIDLRDGKNFLFDARTPLSIYFSVLVLTDTKYDKAFLYENLKETGDVFTRSIGAFLHQYIDYNKVYCTPTDTSRSLRISFPKDNFSISNVVIEIGTYNPDFINLNDIWRKAYYDTIRNING